MEKLIFSLLCILYTGMSFADVRLPSVIGSNMVLQQQSAVKLWGWSGPGEKIYITTSWNNKTDSVSATRDANLQSQSGMVTELYIAGADKIFYPATAKIDHDKLVVWSRSVPQPVAVRYAFGNAAIGNLFGKEGLPVNAFRTDNWDVDTTALKP